MPFSQQLPQSLAQPSPLLRRFTALLEPRDDVALAALTQESALVTRRNFGRAMRLFAPIYLSNECINNCSYCGFSRDNAILRVTLSVDQVVAEARHLADLGFRNLLLVAGEHPRFVSEGYLEECIAALRDFIPGIGLEVGPMESPEYTRMVRAGCESLVVYQETYDPQMYAEMHTAGPKRDFGWRLDCPERACLAGFRRVGVGALFGLSEWQSEALGLAAHLEYLYKHHWKSVFTVALPRLRPAAGGFQPRHILSDRQLIQLMSAFRLCFPEVGIVLSTREPAALRDVLATVGVTTMSAGSHTEPGGYTRQGEDDLHLTVKGRRVELSQRSSCDRAEGQFSISDTRTPRQVATRLTELGLEPVWKDWDAALLAEEVPS